MKEVKVMHKKLAITLIAAAAALLIPAVSASAASASTPAGETAVTPTATCTVCSVEIYPGRGKPAVPMPALPAVGDPNALSSKPEIEITTATDAAAAALKVNIADLEGPYAPCGSDCSKWSVYHNGNVQVSSFDLLLPGGVVEVAHSLVVPSGNQNWQNEGNGLYTPVYFTWFADTTPSDTYYCAHLNLGDERWMIVSEGNTPPNCS
jgi:hypothetical protein